MPEQQRVNIGKQHPASCQALLALSATVEESAARRAWTRSWSGC
ncbi:hypothetical protein [Actinacidiphila glaucinigra]